MSSCNPSPNRDKPVQKLKTFARSGEDFSPYLVVLDQEHSAGAETVAEPFVELDICIVAMHMPKFRQMPVSP